MKQKPKILILAHDQFGYSSTKYKHCEYAQNDFDITYIGWDYDLQKIELPKVEVKYISRKSNIVVRNLRLLYAFHQEVKKGYDLVFANYTRGIALVRLMNPRVKFILYIDTLGIMPSKVKRWLFDTILAIESRFFKNIALISKGISKRLGLKDYHVLPLGGHCFSERPKTFDRLSLLYVGTLSNRRILDCVKGFHKFIDLQEDKENNLPFFTIVGDSPFGELEEIKNYIQLHKLEAYIRTTGFVQSDQLAPFFEEANIGVSYVPITAYYQHQPPTKTFEYLISGLPTIATATEANKEIVKPEVSEIIADNPDAFCDGLVRMQVRRGEFNSEDIRRDYENHTWKYVVRDKFVPLIKRAINL